VGLIAELVRSVQGGPARYATRLAVGPRFTALAGASRPGSAGADAGGVAYTGAAEGRPDFDAAVETAAVTPAVLDRPLAALAYGALEGTVHGRPEGARPHPGPCAAPVALRPDIGAAALNALLGTALRAAGTPLGDENGLDLLARESAGRRLAVVGHFPNLEAIRAGATESWVLELRPSGDDLPATAAPEVLPRADVVGITGSTLANGTLEGLLALCRPDAFVVLIGPTTPLSPLLFDYGVDALCGSLVVDPQEVVSSLGERPAERAQGWSGMRPVSLRPPREARRLRAETIG
jgi:hypothetical protein